MKRKSLFDRYDKNILERFENKYRWNRSMGEDQARAAASAGIDTLYTLQEWNGKNATALFDDALTAAARIDAGFYLR